MRSVLFWEWKRFQRVEWWYVLLFIPMLYMLFMFDFRHGYVPFASGAFDYFMSLALASFIFLSIVLVPRNRPSDLPYVLSRPQESRYVWPIRMVKLFFVVLLITLAVPGSTVFKLYVHDNQIQVGGCDALYQYDKAGFAPMFAHELDRAAYSEFRAGRVSGTSETENCKQYGVVEIPGLADRILAITLLSALILSAAATALLAETRSASRDRARNVSFWLALAPSLFGVAMYVRLFVNMSAERNERFPSDGPLVIYQAAPWVVALLAVAAILYLILAHRAWKRVEVVL